MKFTIKSSKPNDKGNITTIINSTRVEETVFGNKKISETFYVSSDKQLTEGEEININLSDWKIKEQTTPYTDEAGEKIKINWLHLKGSI